MLHLYKRFLRWYLCISYAGETGAATPDHDNNGSNIDDLIDHITHDKRIDGQDLESIKALLNALDNWKEWITAEAIDTIANEIRPELIMSLKQGYTVLDKDSYDVYKRIIAHLHPNAHMPEYQSVKPKFMAVLWERSGYIFKYDQEEDSNIISVFPYEDDSSGAMLSVATINLSKWEFTDSLWLGIDNFEDNNQLDLEVESIQNIDTAIDEWVIVPEPTEEKKEDVPEAVFDFTPSSPTYWQPIQEWAPNQTEPVELYPKWQVNPYDLLVGIWIQDSLIEDNGKGEENTNDGYTPLAWGIDSGEGYELPIK